MNLCKIGLHEYRVVKFSTFPLDKTINYSNRGIFFKKDTTIAKIWFEECYYCQKRRVRKTHKLIPPKQKEADEWLKSR